jgi:hypothetical protein
LRRSVTGASANARSARSSAPARVRLLAQAARLGDQRQDGGAQLALAGEAAQPVEGFDLVAPGGVGQQHQRAGFSGCHRWPPFSAALSADAARPAADAGASASTTCFSSKVSVRPDTARADATAATAARALFRVAGQPPESTFQRRRAAGAK